jgi:superfamily II DNA or RNA helicase
MKTPIDITGKTANEIKTELHFNVLAHWRDHNFRGTALLCTGTGKTRIGVLAAGTFIRRTEFKTKWLIVVPTTNLINNWKMEFMTWGYGDCLNNVDIVCYQSAYKYNAKDYAGIVADEVHTGLSDEYKKVFENNVFVKILCLTATIDDKDKKNYLYHFAPIIDSVTTKEALELGIISPYKIYNLAVPFTDLEQRMYNKANQSYNMYANKLGGIYTAFTKANKVLADSNANAEDKRNAAMLYRAIKARKDLCYNALNKTETTKEILSLFSDRKSIVFSETIEPTMEIKRHFGSSCVLYNSKQHSDLNKKAIEIFQTNPDVKIISSAKALIAGFNVEGLELGIRMSGSSKSLDMVQSLGRITRYVDGKIAIIINLYVSNTQEIKWVESRTKDLEAVWVDSLEDFKNLTREFQNYPQI